MRRTPMKRTGFARHTEGPRHIAEILIGTVLPRLVRIPAPSAPIFNPQPKHDYVRDEGYRRFVASLPCFACGRIGRSQAAHSNAESDGKGGAIKASDAALFPLCADEPGAIGCHTRNQRRAREVGFIERMSAIPRP